VVGYCGDLTVALWLQMDGTTDLRDIEMRTRSGSSEWSASESIPQAAPVPRDFEIRTASNLAGAMVAAWTHVEGQEYFSDVRIVDSNNGWSAQQLLGFGSPSRTALVAIDPMGNALAFGGEETPNGIETWAARYSAGTGWGAPELFAQDAGVLARPCAAALDGEGNAMALETRDSGGLFARRYVTDGGWRDAQLIDEGADACQLRFDPTGNATVIAARVYARDLCELWLSRYSPANGWTGPENIRSVPRGGLSASPALAVDSLGRATLLWREYNSEIMVMRFE
jgi:hypothetical protein